MSSSSSRIGDARGGGIAPNLTHIPGIVINHSPAVSGQYVGSPSIARIGAGHYIASHDFFGPGSTFSRTRIFGSSDSGMTWQPLTEIEGAFWCGLFTHDGALFLMGASHEHGDCIIRRSRDGGKTWTVADGPDTGVLRNGGEYHTAPVPVVTHKGRLWRAMERREPANGWEVNLRALVLSAPIGADLLKASSWTDSEHLRFDPAWRTFGPSGWLEGNVVVTPDNRLVNILRTDTLAGELAATVHISENGRRLTFDPHADLIPMPGAAKKFTIRHDPASRHYWALTNPVLHPIAGRRPAEIRNTLALISSPDLHTWTTRSILYCYLDADVLKVAMQYVDWQFEGSDLIVASRTAFDDGLGGAHNYHDANFLTFHRIANFRARTMHDPQVEP